MNYKKIYDNIIEMRKRSPAVGYTEKHHIVPRSIGGSDDVSNIVVLTAKEHFICHLLLTKIYKSRTIEYYKMIHAFMMMSVISSDTQERYISSRSYEYMKIDLSNRMRMIQTGDRNSNFGNMWIYNEITLDSKCISKLDDIPVNWKSGRIINKEKMRKKLDDIQMKKVCKASKSAETLKKYEHWYEIYSVSGFKEFVKITNYDKTQVALVNAFKKYVKDFIPQQGKSRKIS